MTCPTCRGSGEVFKSFLGLFRWSKTCPLCKGSGTIKDPIPHGPRNTRRVEPEPFVGPVPTPPRVVTRPINPVAKAASSPSRPSSSSGDPLTAAVIAGMTDGDPLEAAVITELTGSTALGVGLSHHSHHEETPPQFEGGGGHTGGAGATSGWDTPPATPVPSPEPEAGLPLIVDPFPSAPAPEPAAERLPAEDPGQSVPSSAPSIEDTTCPVPDNPPAEAPVGGYEPPACEPSSSDSSGTQY